MAEDRSTQRLNFLNDSYEDQLFRIAVNELTADAEGAALLDGGAPDRYGSPSKAAVARFASRVDRIIRKSETTPGREAFRARKVWRKAAVVLLAAVALFAVLMLTVDAFRVRVLNLFMTTEPKYTAVQLTEAPAAQRTAGSVQDWKNAYVPSYIPEGFDLTGSSNSDTGRYAYYRNPETAQHYRFSELSNSDKLTLDSENADNVRQVTINGSDGTLVVKDGVVSLAWTQDQRLFLLNGNIGADEIVRIAESVKFVP